MQQTVVPQGLAVQQVLLLEINHLSCKNYYFPRKMQCSWPNFGLKIPFGDPFNLNS